MHVCCSGLVPCRGRRAKHQKYVTPYVSAIHPNPSYGYTFTRSEGKLCGMTWLRIEKFKTIPSMTFMIFVRVLRSARRATRMR